MQNTNNNYQNEYKKWLSAPSLDPQTHLELEQIANDESKIKEYFAAPLEFGTAGLRGIMRAGINSMNEYVVRQATQGMANLIKSQKLEEKGVAIAYDSRNNSRKYSEEAAAVLAANGIKVYIFDDIRPTPELSFAILELKTAAGINITASHNPKEYNGYKAYWQDGAQLPPEHAAEVSEAINKTDIFTGVITGNYNEYVKSGKIEIIGAEIDESYLNIVVKQSPRPNIIKEVADKYEDFKVIYTPLHGAGYKLVPQILEKRGLKSLKNLLTVEEQMKIDGNFPTVKFPNPEFKEVFNIGIELAKRENCALLIGTDPDSDRVGIVVRRGGVIPPANNVGATIGRPPIENNDNANVGADALVRPPIGNDNNANVGADALVRPQNPMNTNVGANNVRPPITNDNTSGDLSETPEFISLTGNQVGALLLDYIIISRKEAGNLPVNACAIKTIVTTDLAAKICEANGVKIIDVLTGFKFIGEKIKQFEETGESTYIFGFEESYGYLPGTYARDKDAVAASMLIAEMAAYYRTKNMNLADAISELYKKYGYSKETGQNLEFPGVDGVEKMKNLMINLRENAPASLGSFGVKYFKDYKTSQVKNLKTGEISATGLPKSDVLYFDLENGSKVIIRPSGTEPKIKIYYLINALDEPSANAQIYELKTAMTNLL